MSIWGDITIVFGNFANNFNINSDARSKLGAGLGGAGEVNTVRRGADKTLHQLTIILVFIFAPAYYWDRGAITRLKKNGGKI